MMIPDVRVQELVDALNGFVVHEYEYGTDLVNGRAHMVAERVGSDYNLDHALGWALPLPEVAATRTDGGNGAEVELTDGTVLFWEQSECQWCIAACDEAGEP